MMSNQPTMMKRLQSMSNHHVMSKQQKVKEWRMKGNPFGLNATAFALLRHEVELREAARPKRQTRSTKREDYVYDSLAILIDRIMDKQ
jgi:hypothetical protein